MIAIQRLSDDVIMPIRQSSDWGKKQQLQNLEDQWNALSPQDQAANPDLQATIVNLQAEWADWKTFRCQLAADKYGGVATDYQTIQVPQNQESDFFIARDITESGGILTIDTRPLYTIAGSEITVTSGWVKGNHRLLADDVTDFSTLALTEPLYFRLVFAQDTNTLTISVQLLTRQEDEEFGALPVNLDQCMVIVEGRVNIDLTIDEGVF